MRTTRFLFALIAAGALAGLPAAANAVDCVGAISLGETNATETLYAGNISSPGSILTIRGVVDCFSAPVLACVTAGYEYTIVYTGGSGGTAVTPGVGPGGLWTAYETHYGGGAAFTIYEDTTPDANPAVPGSYTDGSVFLTGTVGDLKVLFFLEGAIYRGGNFDSGVTASFTGGSGSGCVSSVDGVPCPLRLTGGWNVSPGAVLPGYTAEVAGKLDVQCPTATESSTFGRVKVQYR